jgi:hypothetical protein
MARILAMPILALSVAGWAFTAAAPVHAAIAKDTVITSYADNTAPKILALQKDQDPAEYATVDPGTDGQWLAPIAFGPNGHLYLGSKANQGSLWDITDGGDRTSDKPIAIKIFSEIPHKIGGIAFDAEANAYLSVGQTQGQDDDSSLNDQTYPISRVEMSTGKVTYLNGTFNHAWGLAIRKNAVGKEILHIAEGNTGRVLTYNLTDNKLDDRPLATGFPAIPDHMGGALAFDPRGKLFVLWRLDPNDGSGGGVFDITAGGDFSDFTKTPPVAMYPNRMDVQGMAFDSKNNLYVGGDNTNFVWFSPFDATKGTFGEFVQFTSSDNGGGDTETVAIAP